MATTDERAYALASVTHRRRASRRHQSTTADRRFGSSGLRSGGTDARAHLPLGLARRSSRRPSRPGPARSRRARARRGRRARAFRRRDPRRALLRARHAGGRLLRLDRQLLARSTPGTPARRPTRARRSSPGDRRREVTRSHGCLDHRVARRRRCSRTATARRRSRFMEEWGRFAEAVGVDLFEVIERDPPAPDPLEHAAAGVRRRRLLPDQGPAVRQVAAARALRLAEELDVPVLAPAVAVNREMPLVEPALSRALLVPGLRRARRSC